MWWLAPLIQGVSKAIMVPRVQEQERKDRQTAATLAYIGNRDLAMQAEPEAKDPWAEILGATTSGMSLPGMGGGAAGGGAAGGGAAGGGGGGGGGGPMMMGAGLTENPGYQDQFFADQDKYYSDKPQTAALLSGLSKPSMGSGSNQVMSRGAVGGDPYAQSGGIDPNQRFWDEQDAYYSNTPGPTGPVARQLANMGWGGRR